MVLQQEKSDFILAMIIEIEGHESRNNWTLMKNIEVRSKHKIKMVRSIFFIHLVFQAQEITRWKFNEKKSRLCVHGGMQQWGVNYWENYDSVVNWR